MCKEHKDSSPSPVNSQIMSGYTQLTHQDNSPNNTELIIRISDNVISQNKDPYEDSCIIPLARYTQSLNDPGRDGDNDHLCHVEAQIKTEKTLR
eukprot:XP_001708335.1 Hypothetical protein GL50803_36612 [Giardia lamblia ATCC 50803]